MTPMNRAQRVALKRVFDRGPIWVQSPAGSCITYQLSYRQFRASAQPTIGCDGAVALHWHGMWLGIEKDGYCHS